MAVSEQTPYIQYTANGIAKSFALEFDCENQDHLIVLVDEIEPPIATWSLTGGNVVFTTAPAAGKKIKLQRNTPFGRTTNYQSFNNSFRPQTVNIDFDQIWWKLQELGVADWLMKLYVDRLHQQQEQKINDLKGYVDDRDDELRAYLMEEIRKQGVALDQLDDYYNYLMQRLAQIAVDRGWMAEFVIDASGKNQQEINNLFFNSGFTNVKAYGAKCDGVTDDSAAIANAAQAAISKGAALLVNGMCNINKPITLPSDLRVVGTGHNSGFTSGLTTTLTVLDNVSFDNLAILNNSVFHYCVMSASVNAPSFFNCKINGRIYCDNTSLDSNLRGIVLVNCLVGCDFGADYDGIKEYDVFANYGLQSPLWLGNNIQVANVHRIFKISQGRGEEITAIPGDTRVRGARIIGNRITGYGGKQVIDSYFGTSGIILADNYFGLPDTATLSGARFTTLIEDKSVLNQRNIGDVGVNIIISGNIGYMACNLAMIQGSYGVTTSGLDGSGKSTAKITNNTLKRIIPNARPFVQIRHFHNVTSDGNMFDVVCDVNQSAVQYLSNKDLIIGDSDIYSGGSIDIGTTTENSMTNTFTGKTGNVNIGSVMVKDYDDFGAVKLSRLDADYVRIDGVKSRPVSSPTLACRAVNASSTVAIRRLDITNMDATHPTGENVTPAMDANALVNATITDCSWQPRFRGFVSAIPTTRTYVRGDTLQQLSPNSGQPLEWVCISGNSNGGAWRLSKYVANKSTTSNRPTLSFSDMGVLYFDTTLAAEGKPIWWTGAKWVDTNGNEV